jgi:RimJ/RimL family protein N-acetyltransferase
VQEFWGNARYEEPYEQYVFRTNDGAVEQFIIEADGANALPIGYFQFYWASRVGGGWWEGFDEATAGIDFYIGETSWLGKGAGLKVLDEAKKMLFANHRIKRIIADPSPKNARIIHLLKKAGFQPNAEIETPDGRALLMELWR